MEVGANTDYVICVFNLSLVLLFDCFIVFYSGFSIDAIARNAILLIAGDLFAVNDDIWILMLQFIKQGESYPVYRSVLIATVLPIVEDIKASSTLMTLCLETFSALLTLTQGPSQRVGSHIVLRYHFITQKILHQYIGCTYCPNSRIPKKAKEEIKSITWIWYTE